MGRMVQVLVSHAILVAAFGVLAAGCDSISTATRCLQDRRAIAQSDAGLHDPFAGEFASSSTEALTRVARLNSSRRSGPPAVATPAASGKPTR